MLLLEKPDFSEGFTFSAQTVEIMLIVLAFIGALALCFFGKRFFGALIFSAVGLVCGYLGILVAETMTSNKVLFLIFFMLFAAVGFCAAFFVSLPAEAFLKTTRLKQAMNENAWWLTAAAGALAAAAVCYFFIYQSLPVALMILTAAGGGGMAYQHKKRGDEKPFYTYDDLYKLKPLGEESAAADGGGEMSGDKNA